MQTIRSYLQTSFPCILFKMFQHFNIYIFFTLLFIKNNKLKCSLNLNQKKNWKNNKKCCVEKSVLNSEVQFWSHWTTTALHEAALCKGKCILQESYEIGKIVSQSQCGKFYLSSSIYPLSPSWMCWNCSWWKILILFYNFHNFFSLVQRLSSPYQLLA